jgi:hypothetical protein
MCGQFDLRKGAWFGIELNQVKMPALHSDRASVLLDDAVDHPNAELESDDISNMDLLFLRHGSFSHSFVLFPHGKYTPLGPRPALNDQLRATFPTAIFQGKHQQNQWCPIMTYWERRVGTNGWLG